MRTTKHNCDVCGSIAVYCTIASLSLVLGGVLHKYAATDAVTEEPVPYIIIPEEVLFEPELTPADSVFLYIHLCQLQHPDIVMAQCVEESGNFTSTLWRHGNNCLGMKLARQRPTLANGEIYGHARYPSYKECIGDYAIWQSIYARNLTREDYFSYLDRLYATKKRYSNRLRQIIKAMGL